MKMNLEETGIRIEDAHLVAKTFGDSLLLLGRYFLPVPGLIRLKEVNQEEWSALFFVEIPDLLLNRLEHPRLAAFATDTEGSAELPAEFHDTDGGQVDIFHIVLRTR